MSVLSAQVPLTGMSVLEFAAFIAFIILAYWAWTKVASATS